MTSAPPSLPIGRRIKHYRRQNGNRSVAVIAGLCGITERYLHLIEAGQKIPSTEVLTRIANELGVPAAALLAEDPPGESAPTQSVAPAVARALMGHAPARAGDPASPAQLRERVEQTWHVWQDCKERFTEVARVLPSLIVDVERAVRAHRHANDPAARRDVLRVAADLYGLLRSYCRRTGRLDLALMVADRAMRAAEDADDPVRIAAAAWNLGHVLLSHNEPSAVEEAKDIALVAVEQLRRTPETQESCAVQGALELVAVVSDARRRNWWEARQRLEQRAAPLARRAGEGNVHWTVFGPTNVRLHAMSIEMLAGEASEGLRVADQVDITGLPSRERQFTFGLEVARCHDLRREDAAVLVHLLGLEDLAPEDLARSPLARDIVLSLHERVRPTFRPHVTALAERLQLI
ncbi:transcriptional regulator [Streptomyces viridochromogenes]|uniref:Transcriptional regulator n=1 Tax=Streptomyces viridochromogenes TaxID=1938 RepID=A0A0J7ZG85_STRVR|nr:helix-turn-helix transcriptional regulator [Streptomyces viridochromogenes]KMS74188.1 transcriptional regulator [Streptomyces viridochromogenes]